MTTDPAPADALLRIRQEIENVDRSILLLIAARLDAAERAIRLRTAGRHRITDREQERRVFLRSQTWAEELGLSPKLVEALFRSLIGEGKARFLCRETARDSLVVTELPSGPGTAVTHLEGEVSGDPSPVSTSR